MRTHLPFRPGQMPAMFGDTAAALIVDDDAQLAGTLARVLARGGYEPTVAASGAEARARLAEKDFAVALVDVLMPDESGLELIADLLEKHRDLAVVMVTGIEDPAIADLALESGAYGYVVKPFRPNQVLITVANAGRRRCLEIERRHQHARLEQLLLDRTADLGDAWALLDEAGDAAGVGARGSRSQFRGLLEAAPDAILAVNDAGRIVFANAQTSRLFGYDRRELVGQPVELLVPEHARASHPQRRREYLDDPQPRPMGAGMDLAGRRKDGTQFPAEISLSAIETAEGVVVAAAIRDVTDRKRAEAKFRGLLEAAPDAIIGVDTDGRIALVNAQAERLFGYRRDEMLGQHVELLVPDAARELHPERRTSYFANPAARPMGAGVELAGRRKDGTEFPAEISLSSLDTEDGMLVSAAIRDVSDRRRAVEAQARLASIIQSSHDAIIGKTLDGVVTSWNPGAERLYGYTAEEILGRHVDVLFPPHRRAEEADILERIGHGMRIVPFRTRQMRKDGSIFTAALTVSPITAPNGTIIGVASVSRDISELERTEAKFRALLDAAPDAIVAVDEDGCIALVNAQAERLFGYDRGELLGQQVELLVPEHARAVHPSRRQGYLADPEPRPMGAGMELAGRRKDGYEFPAEISLSTIDTGEGVLVSAAIRDVTDRKRAEAKFRGLLEAAPDAIVGVDPDGRIALVNTQAEALFGYSRQELLGQAVEILVPDAARPVHPQRRTGYFRDPKSRPMGAGMELAGRRKDGTEFPAEISLSSLETEDGLLVSAAVRDVSERIEAQAERERLKAQAERERLERQLHQSQRLESLGQLAGGVAHDFNNLLAVIVNYTDFISEEVAAAATGPDATRWTAVGDDIAQVKRAAERATQLTHQLLAFGRREVVQPRVLDLNEVVGDVEQLLRRSIGEHVELAITLAPDLWPTFVDPGQFEQVLVNLAVNARDAMPGGGTLAIATRNVTVDDDYAATSPDLSPGDYVQLRVSDTGIGMDDEIRQRVFEPFFTTKLKGEGSGLGLATVYGIVTQAGGHVHIYSEPGHGTTFSALLPATDREATTTSQQPITAPSTRGGETILVVEDEPAMREVTRRILNRNGHQVLVAEGGSDAVGLATTHDGPIHLLLTDVVMPQMLGKDVADQIRAIRPGIRVLFMSGYAQPVLASQGTLGEGVTLVEKPFSEAHLVTKVRQVLDEPDARD